MELVVKQTEILAATREAKNNYDMNVHNTKFGLHLVLPGKSSFHEFLH